MKNTPRFLAKTDKVVKTAQNSIKIIIIIIASLADNHVPAWLCMHAKCVRVLATVCQIQSFMHYNVIICSFLLFFVVLCLPIIRQKKVCIQAGFT